MWHPGPVFKKIRAYPFVAGKQPQAGLFRIRYFAFLTHPGLQAEYILCNTLQNATWSSAGHLAGSLSLAVPTVS